MTLLCRIIPIAVGFPLLTAGQADLEVDLISRSSDNKTLGTFYGSSHPAIGGLDATGEKEGQYAAYMTSWKTDAKHGGQKRQIVWFNRGNKRTALVSLGFDDKGANADCYNPAISNSGMDVVFETSASNLDPNDNNKVSDVYIWQLVPSAKVTRVSEGANAPSAEASISGNGRYVAFTSNATTLAGGVKDTSSPNVYLRDMQTGAITLISKNPKTGDALSGSRPSISEDGSRIAFYSFSDKLVGGDNNDLWDIFIWTRGSNEFKRISKAFNGAERDGGTESRSRVVSPTISGDGKYVAYSTTSSNVADGDSNKMQDVFVVEIETGAVIRVSEGPNNLQSNGDSPAGQGEKIALSHDGKWVAFTTNAKNLGGNMILKNWETGQTLKFGEVGRNGSGTPAITRNAKWFAFPSSEKLDKRFNSSGIFAIKNPLIKP